MHPKTQPPPDPSPPSSRDSFSLQCLGAEHGTLCSLPHKLGQNGVSIPKGVAIKGRLLRNSFSFLLLLNLCKLESQIYYYPGIQQAHEGLVRDMPGLFKGRDKR